MRTCALLCGSKTTTTVPRDCEWEPSDFYLRLTAFFNFKYLEKLKAKRSWEAKVSNEPSRESDRERTCYYPFPCPDLT